jgi:hypothetical protein
MKFYKRCAPLRMSVGADARASRVVHYRVRRPLLCLGVRQPRQDTAAADLNPGPDPLDFPVAPAKMPMGVSITFAAEVDRAATSIGAARGRRPAERATLEAAGRPRNAQGMLSDRPLVPHRRVDPRPPDGSVLDRRRWCDVFGAFQPEAVKPPFQLVSQLRSATRCPSLVRPPLTSNTVVDPGLFSIRFMIGVRPRVAHRPLRRTGAGARRRVRVDLAASRRCWQASRQLRIYLGDLPRQVRGGSTSCGRMPAPGRFRILQRDLHTSAAAVRIRLPGLLAASRISSGRTTLAFDAIRRQRILVMESIAANGRK